jgi:choline-sulfatase
VVATQRQPVGALSGGVGPADGPDAGIPPRRAGGASLSTPVSLLDLYPTLCSLSGVEPPDGLDGVDLSAAVRTGEEPDRGPVVTDHLAYGGGLGYRMVRDGRYRYVGFRDAPELLFDIEADPLEQENLAPDADGEDREALQRLRGYVADTVDFDAVDSRRAAFQERVDPTLPVPPGTGNAYLLPDGRLVDAATPLYAPDELVDGPVAGVWRFPRRGVRPRELNTAGRQRRVCRHRPTGRHARPNDRY